MRSPAAVLAFVFLASYDATESSRTLPSSATSTTLTTNQLPQSRQLRPQTQDPQRTNVLRIPLQIQDTNLDSFTLSPIHRMPGLYVH